MAEKALIRTIDYVKKTAKGDFQLGFTAVIGYDTESYVTLTAFATSATFDAALPTWRTLIKDAVIAEALKVYNLTIDSVLFNDLGVISII